MSTYLISFTMMSLMAFFTFSKIPLTLSFIVILTAMSIAISTYILSSTSWFSFILFLIFVSAMMIIFVYISSLSLNDFVVNANIFFFKVSLTVFFILTFISSSFSYNYHLTPMSLTYTLDAGITPSLMQKMYTPYITLISIFLIIYLLIALIVVAKNSQSSAGALRVLK